MNGANDKPGLVWRTAVWSLLLATAVIWWWSLVRDAAVPGGRLDMATDFLSAHPHISRLKPNERMRTDEDGEVRPQDAIGSPLYVDVSVPAGYGRVTARFEVKTEAPIVEIGGMTRAGGEFDMKTGLNRNLDGLNWPVVTEGRLRLYQRTPTYDSVDEFFRNPPPLQMIATYGDPQLPAMSISGYVPQAERRELHLSLQGRHRMRVYLGGEDLDLEFALQDMNRALGADPVRVAVYEYGGTEPLYDTALPDDGNDRDDQSASGIRTLKVNWHPPHDGFYLIDLATSDDVFIRRVFTPQSRFSFVGRVHVGDQIGYWDQPNPVEVTLAGWTLAAKAPTIAGRQTLDVDRMRLHIWEPLRLYEWVTGGMSRFVVQERPVILYTEGEMSLSDKTFPVERLRYVSARETPAQTEMDGVGFVLADYGPAAEIGKDTFGIEAEFDVSELARTPEGRYRFVLWLPMQSEWGDIEVRRAEFTWMRAPLRRVADWWGQFSDDAISGSYPTDDAVSPKGWTFDEYVP